MVSAMAADRGWTLAAFGVSIALHVLAYAWFVVFRLDAPRLILPSQVEVSFLTSVPQPTSQPVERRPAPRAAQPRPEPQEQVATPEPEPAPSPKPVESDINDNALAEARYDVAALNNPPPQYPLSARRRGMEGKVVLTAQVGADGRCGQVKLKQSSGYDALDAAALETVRRWRFIPARRGRTPVDSWVEVPITFRLNEANS